MQGPSKRRPSIDSLRWFGTPGNDIPPIQKQKEQKSGGWISHIIRFAAHAIVFLTLVFLTLIIHQPLISMMLGRIGKSSLLSMRRCLRYNPKPMEIGITFIMSTNNLNLQPRRKRSCKIHLQLGLSVGAQFLRRDTSQLVSLCQCSGSRTRLVEFNSVWHSFLAAIALTIYDSCRACDLLCSCLGRRLSMVTNTTYSVRKFKTARMHRKLAALGHDSTLYRDRELRIVSPGMLSYVLFRLLKRSPWWRPKEYQ